MASEIIDTEEDEEFLDSASSVESICNPNALRLDQRCRACESADVVMDLAEKENFKLLSKFRACVDIEVDIFDPLPNQLCSGCVNNIEFFYKFKIKCEYIDKKMRDLILSKCSNKHEINKHHKERGANNFETIVSDEDHLMEESQVVQIEKTEKPYFLSYEEGNNVDVSNFELQREIKVEKQGERSDGLVIAKSNTKSSSLSIKKKTNTTYECETCHETFSQAGQLHMHVKSHGKKRFKCGTCDRWFYRRSVFKDHMNSHASDFEKKMYKCKICTNEYANPGNLYRHIRELHEKRKDFSCDKCGKSFTQASVLQEHQITHMEERNFACDTCQKRFHTSKRLEMHKNTHIPIELREMKKGTVGNTRKSFHHKQSVLCSVCGKQYTLGTLEYHMRTHTGERPFECEFCHKRFISKTSINLHKLLHTGEKPYKCDVCGKSFRQLGHLKCHMLTHTGQKNYVCNICSKSFTLNGNLTVHMRTHTGEPPYKKL